MKNKLAVILSLMLAFAPCTGVLGADAGYVGEFELGYKPEDTVLGVFYEKDSNFDTDILSVHSKRVTSDNSFLTIDDYTISSQSLQWNNNYSFVFTGPIGNSYNYEFKDKHLKNTLVRDASGHNWELSFSRPYYDAMLFQEETHFYTADIKGAFLYKGKYTGYFSLEDDGSYGFYHLDFDYTLSKEVSVPICEFVPPEGELVVYAFDSENGIALITENADTGVITPYIYANEEWSEGEELKTGRAFDTLAVDSIYGKMILYGIDNENYSDVICYDANKCKWIDMECTLAHSQENIIKATACDDDFFMVVFDEDMSKARLYKSAIPAETVGDVDRNGIFTANDAAKALSHTLLPEQTGLDKQQIKLADADGNGIITANDSAVILSMALKGR